MEWNGMEWTQTDLPNRQKPFGCQPTNQPTTNKTLLARQVTALLVARHPSLRPLAREGHDYLLSSLQKLDQAPTARASSYSTYTAAGAAPLGGEAAAAAAAAQQAMLPRPVVLAVVGRSHLSYVQRNW